MRFVINQKLLSIAGKYFIKDELGNDAFVVKGNFSLPRKYRVYDMQNNEIVRIKNVCSVCFRASITIREIRWFAMQNANSLLSRSMSFRNRRANRRLVFAFNYKVVRDGVVIASVYKAVTFMRDSYVVDIFDAANIPLVLAIAVMFDHVHHRGNSGIIGQ